MASEPESKTVSELQEQGILLVEDGNHGENRPRPDEFVDQGVKFIRAADMDGGRVLFEAAQCINAVARKRVRKGIGAGGDVLLSHKGTVGKVAYVPFDAPDFVCSPQTTFWRVTDETRLDRRYLYFYLQSREFVEQLDARKGETDMAPYVSLTNQRTLSITLPPLPEQKAIARILGTMDDKIELNRRMNATLEAMARALFQSWFVDAVPAGGALSEGWEVSTIGMEAKVVGGSTPSTKSPEFWDNGEFYWVTPKDFSSLQSKVLIGSSRKVTQAGLDQITSGLLPENTVLLSSRAPVGYLALTKIKTAINQGFIAMICEQRLSPEYVMLWADSIMDKIKQAASGTTFAEISKATFRPFPIIVPPAERLDQFTAIVRALYDRISANERQSVTLAETRDTLLPRLLNGELRTEEVADAG